MPGGGGSGDNKWPIYGRLVVVVGAADADAAAFFQSKTLFFGVLAASIRTLIADPHRFSFYFFFSFFIFISFFFNGIDATFSASSAAASSSLPVGHYHWQYELSIG